MQYKDPTKKILSALYQTLSGITEANTYSFVPSNKDKPYIYIGDIQLIEQKVSCFVLSGTLTVELFTGTNRWTGSLETPLEISSRIKWYMKRDKNSILNLSPTHTMIYMRMVNDSGLQQISNIENLYINTIQYEFELQQNPGYTERVITDHGILESPDCIPFEYI